MDKVCVIIPVKDEETGLKYLLDNYRASELNLNYDVDFIFVIDCRTSDDSKLIAKKLNGRLVDQKESHGKGAAVRQAVGEWKNNTTDLVVFLDADGSYSFEDVHKVLDALSEDIDVVSGSRFLSGGGRPVGMSRLHNFGNKALSYISSVRNRRRISDLCTGLWAFRKDAILNLDFRSNGFDLEAELMGLMREKNLNHSEIAVNWSQRKGGSSKLRSLRDGIIILKRIIIT